MLWLLLLKVLVVKCLVFKMTFLLADVKNLVSSNFSKELTTNEDERRISPSGESGNGTRRLQDEINTLTKRNCGMS